MAASFDLIRYYFAKQREHFTLPEDTYGGWVILAAQSGRFRYSLTGHESAAGIADFGELVFCPPGTALQRETLSPVSFHFIEFSAGSEDWPAGKVRIHDVARLSSTYHYLQQWQDEPAQHKLTEDVQHLVADLLFMVKRELAYSDRTSPSVPDPLMDQAAAYMEQHACQGELSLQALADRLGIGASQLTRRFQTAYGMPPVKYMTKVRLSKAQLLLAETNDTLDVISESCGFQNAFYFSRVFSQHMQISPSAYRRTFRV